MVTRRRALPFVFLGALTVLTAVGAIIGFRAAPSSDQLTLQAAYQKTTEAEGFRFMFVFTVTEQEAGIDVIFARVQGIWATPDRMLLAPPGHHGVRPATIIIGSSQYSVSTRGKVTHDFISPPLVDPFSSSAPAAFPLPPLGDIPKATDVVRNGDTYTFIVPHTILDIGWEAYAGNQVSTSPGPVALNTLTRVVIKDGYIVSMSYPRGIHSGHVSERPAAWRLYDFNNTPPVEAPHGAGR